jgi:hypothetical protein
MYSNSLGHQPGYHIPNSRNTNPTLLAQQQQQQQLQARYQVGPTQNRNSPPSTFTPQSQSPLLYHPPPAAAAAPQRFQYSPAIHAPMSTTSSHPLNGTAGNSYQPTQPSYAPGGITTGNNMQKYNPGPGMMMNSITGARPSNSAPTSNIAYSQPNANTSSSSSSLLSSSNSQPTLGDVKVQQQQSQISKDVRGDVHYQNTAQSPQTIVQNSLQTPGNIPNPTSKILQQLTELQSPDAQPTPTTTAAAAAAASKTTTAVVPSAHPSTTSPTMKTGGGGQTIILADGAKDEKSGGLTTSLISKPVETGGERGSKTGVGGSSSSSSTVVSSSSSSAAAAALLTSSNKQGKVETKIREVSGLVQEAGEAGVKGTSDDLTRTSSSSQSTVTSSGNQTKKNTEVDEKENKKNKATL